MLQINVTYQSHVQMIDKVEYLYIAMVQNKGTLT